MLPFPPEDEPDIFETLSESKSAPLEQHPGNGAARGSGSRSLSEAQVRAIHKHPSAVRFTNRATRCFQEDGALPPPLRPMMTTAPPRRMVGTFPEHRTWAETLPNVVDLDHFGAGHPQFKICVSRSG